MQKDLEFRFAIENDVLCLARMNKELIRDEGHRNKMSLPRLKQRMAGFLSYDYEKLSEFYPRLYLELAYIILFCYCCLVELVGIKPTTFALQGQRSLN